MDTFDLDDYFENDAENVFWALSVGLVDKDLNEYFFKAKKAFLGRNGLGEAAGKPVAP